MTTKTTWSGLAVLALLAAPTTAAGQTVYRCEGNTYGTQPCEGGRAIQPAESPSAGQKAQADAATQRDAKLGASMEKARLAQEKEGRKGQAYIPPPKPEIKPVVDGKKATKPKKTASKPEYFTAVAPAKPGAKDHKKKKKRKPAA